LSVLVVRAGAVALTMTGLSLDTARFQSLSAFTGVGFTTAESESIVNHSARRRIISALMLLGNAGLFSALGALITGLARDGGDEILPSILFLILGIGILLLLSRVHVLNRALNRILQALFIRLRDLRIYDYEEILQVDKGYAVYHIPVEQDGWLAERTLRDLSMIAEGVLVLSIARANGQTLATPGPITCLRTGDILLCYGRERDLIAISERKRNQAGEDMHREAVERQRLFRAKESAQDLKAS
jgi:hypothetical protein